MQVFAWERLPPQSLSIIVNWAKLHAMCDSCLVGILSSSRERESACVTFPVCQCQCVSVSISVCQCQCVSVPMSVASYKMWLLLGDTLKHLSALKENKEVNYSGPVRQCAFICLYQYKSPDSSSSKGKHSSSSKEKYSSSSKEKHCSSSKEKGWIRR